MGSIKRDQTSLIVKLVAFELSFGPPRILEQKATEETKIPIDSFPLFPSVQVGLISAPTQTAICVLLIYEFELQLKL